MKQEEDRDSGGSQTSIELVGARRNLPDVLPQRSYHQHDRVGFLFIYVRSIVIHVTVVFCSLVFKQISKMPFVTDLQI